MILVKRKCHNYDVRFIVMLLLLRPKIETIGRNELLSEYNKSVLRPKIPHGSERWVFRKMESYGLLMQTHVGGRNKCFIEITDEGRILANSLRDLVLGIAAPESIILTEPNVLKF